MSDSKSNPNQPESLTYQRDDRPMPDGRKLMLYTFLEATGPQIEPNQQGNLTEEGPAEQ